MSLGFCGCLATNHNTLLELEVHDFLEDDSSTSSTVSVRRVANKNRAPPTFDYGDATRPRVRFDLDGNTHHENVIMYKEDCARLWYRNSEIFRFKTTAIALAREIAKAEKRSSSPHSYVRLITRLYNAGCCCQVDTADTGLQGHQHRDDSSREQPSMHERDCHHLRRWMQVAPSRLGLERWSSRFIGEERRVRRSEIIDLVLDLQESPSADEEGKALYIRRSCERLSGPSRLFAQKLAKSLVPASCTKKRAMQQAAADAHAHAAAATAPANLNCQQASVACHDLKWY